MSVIPDEIVPGEKYIDSRDVEERIEYLQSEQESLQSDIDEAEDEDKGSYIDALNEWEDEYGEELKNLLSLQEECSGYGDWKYGETLILDSEWVDYCRELCEDIGSIPKDLPSYIENNIDWEGVADDIEQDYMRVNFGSEEYLMRSA